MSGVKIYRNFTDDGIATSSRGSHIWVAIRIQGRLRELREGLADKNKSLCRIYVMAPRSHLLSL